ncbi:MAG: response regulator [Chitinivibrionales bacterium]|nr:response regulator [Chitinivibrionales bacterium]
MKMLVVEDDFNSRKLLLNMLLSYGECDVAVDGREAVRAVKISWNEQKPYKLIFLDIMLPEMDGHEVLKKIRELEEEKGFRCSDGVKIVMTTALDDKKNIMQAFRHQCEGYLVKPITRAKLEAQLQELGLL